MVQEQEQKGLLLQELEKLIAPISSDQPEKEPVKFNYIIDDSTS